MSNESPNLKGLLRSGAKVPKDAPESGPPTINFSSIGDRKVGHPIPVQSEKEISFESIGGKCVRRASDHPMNERAESTRKEDDAHKVSKEQPREDRA
jgi:hypothetical protein